MTQRFETSKIMKKCKISIFGKDSQVANDTEG